jgi:hypothetical protein
MPESDLHIVGKVREKLRAGALSRADPVKIWAGYGRAERCAACDAAILPEQVEYEIDRIDGPTVHFHAECYAIWEIERRREGRPT